MKQFFKKVKIHVLVLMRLKIVRCHEILADVFVPNETVKLKVTFSSEMSRSPFDSMTNKKYCPIPFIFFVPTSFYYFFFSFIGGKKQCASQEQAIWLSSKAEQKVFCREILNNSDSFSHAFCRPIYHRLIEN